MKKHGGSNKASLKPKHTHVGWVRGGKVSHVKEAHGTPQKRG